MILGPVNQLAADSIDNTAGSMLFKNLLIGFICDVTFSASDNAGTKESSKAAGSPKVKSTHVRKRNRHKSSSFLKVTKEGKSLITGTDG